MGAKTNEKHQFVIDAVEEMLNDDYYSMLITCNTNEDAIGLTSCLKRVFLEEEIIVSRRGLKVHIEKIEW